MKAVEYGNPLRTASPRARLSSVNPDLLASDNETVKRKRTRQQKEHIRHATAAAMHRLRLQNRRASRIPPYGYQLAADGKTLVPDGAEQEIIIKLREAWSGRSYHQLADHMNDSGVKPRAGKRWYASTVRSVMLRREEKMDFARAFGAARGL